MTAASPSAPPPLELACADFTFPLLPHDRVLALIAALEIPAVDIGLFEDRSHLQPGTEFQVLARNELDGAMLATMAVVDGAIFIRTESNLYRIEDER